MTQLNIVVSLVIISVLINGFLVRIFYALFKKRRLANKILMIEGDEFLKKCRYVEATRVFFTLLKHERTEDVHLKYVSALRGNNEFELARREVKKILYYDKIGIYNLDSYEFVNHQNYNKAYK